MWIYIIILLSISILGLISNIINLKKMKENYIFINDYYKKFQNLIDNVFEKNNIKSRDYAWLMTNCDKMQYILGESGIISYIEGGRYYNNIPLLLNVMNEITSYVNNPLVGENEIKMVQWCQNAFLRKTGILNDYIKNETKRIYNPLYSLSAGIKFILLIPVEILNSIGLISNNGKNKINDNKIVKILSGILSLITILSAIITIVIGWNNFVEIIKAFFNN